jgi:hypothetical protein
LGEERKENLLPRIGSEGGDGCRGGNRCGLGSRGSGLLRRKNNLLSCSPAGENEEKNCSDEKQPPHLAYLLTYINRELISKLSR